jgi:tRNA threonylcarbamoyl adenosine modification protein YeaZ
MNGLTLVVDLSSALYLGLVDGGKVLAARIRPQGTRGENAHALLDECLSEAGAAPADLAAICVGIGPGSFTGIRVCAAMAQGLAFARRLPLYPFSSLAALETALPGDSGEVGHSAIAATAGRYYVRSRRDGSESLLPADALLALGSPSGLVISGNFPDRDRIAPAFGTVLAFEERADFVRIAARAGQSPPVRDGVLRPNYLAASAAEDKRRAGLAGSGEAAP